MDSYQIRLLSFELSSSLIDWRKMLEPFLGHEALTASQKIFGHSLPGSSRGQFEDVLNHAIGVSENKGSRRLWDKIAFYEDVRHLHMLRHRCAMLAVGDFSPNMALMISAQLGIAFDHYICSSEIGSFSDTKEFWLAALDQVKKKFSCQPAQWLHISSASHSWHDVARKLGVRTGFIPRPAAGSAAEMMTRDPDLLASDLNQLEFGFTQAALAPVRYRVIASAPHAKTIREFVKWMHREHGEELLTMAGCTEFRVFQLSPTQVAAEYIFRDQSLLNHYLEYEAPKLRAKGLEYFPPELMKFERDIQPMLCCGSKRKPIDFGGDLRP